ncbi:orotidine-5'-phosphate decarboxylase [Catellatospora chokoriensis]|uniref:Orotidine-5'-phosphate decarboxylase n=1 Tax=Catellatospora chokoriensis TaxID=310353 RepID=A0A8J3KAK8_9ACTN|nr:orotidine-5'-phosphate decarboxylase [Catellatospora chokoriensis]GIF93720.1 orotidine 5'-phosphate decarboxylase [Catellatospora chokoriensis]
MREEVFTDLLSRQWAQGRMACVGLDPDMAVVRASVTEPDTEQAITAYACAIVDATADLVCAYKPNIAFYERWGVPGLAALKNIITHINTVAPQTAVIVDAKRGDIASTNEAYRDALFGYFGADAVTVQPYLGVEALRPFLDTRDKGVIVLCRTSNPGSGELQNLQTSGETLYQRVARLAQHDWNTQGNVGLLVGGTYPQEIAEVRTITPTLPLLVAGVGRQGGSVGDAVRAGATAFGGMIISSSRAVIEAAPGPAFAEAARQATIRLHAEIEQARSVVTA